MSASKNLIQAAANASGGAIYSHIVDYSCRFNDNDSAHLSRTPSGGGAGNTTFTVSVWVKRSNLNTYQVIFGAGSDTSNRTALRFESNNTLSFFLVEGGSTVVNLATEQVFRDPSSWYHIVCTVDSMEATEGNRVKIWVNGSQAVLSGTYPSLTKTFDTGTTQPHLIGESPGATQYLDAYLSQVVYTDGIAYPASAFGRNKNGIWAPKDVSTLTFGSNGFYLDFADSSNLGNDVSQGNNFISSGLLSSDQVIDTPTNNFATLSPIYNVYSNGGTLYNGNLGFYTSGTQTYPSAHSTMHMPLGGGYVEARILQKVYQDYAGTFGIISSDLSHSIHLSTNGQLQQSGQSVIGTSLSWGAGDYLAIAYDPSTGIFKTWKNGGSVATTTCTKPELTYLVFCQGYTSGWHSMVLNFGQDSTFVDVVTAGSYTDANGLGSFRYSQSTDYLALCSANLPEPTIGPNSATKADSVFGTSLYTGNGIAIGSGGKTISDLRFRPNLVWIKNRDTIDSHMLFDAVRGETKYLESDTADAEATDTESLTSFTPSGFTLGNNAAVNTIAEDYVAWNWVAKGSGVTNTDGDITSTVSADQDAGISIVSYTGNGSSNQTVGHGLGADVSMVIVKRYDSSSYVWRVWHSGLSGDTYYLGLNQTGAQSSSSTVFNGHSSTTFTVGSDPSVNGSSGTMVAYCFAEVEGFSRFGKYSGNGSAEGPFIFTGFRPAWIMIKEISNADDWMVTDATINSYNPAYYQLKANTSGAVVGNTSSPKLDFVSNGVKLRASDGALNTSGSTYIYMAFAENPFKYSNAR